MSEHEDASATEAVWISMFIDVANETVMLADLGDSRQEVIDNARQQCGDKPVFAFNAAGDDIEQVFMRMANWLERYGVPDPEATAQMMLEDIKAAFSKRADAADDDNVCDD